MNSNRDRIGTDSEADRARWVQRYRASGLGLKRFAAQNALKAGQLHYWTYNPRSSSAAATPAAAVFREIAVPKEWKPQPSWAAEIGLSDGTAVRLDGRVDVAWASTLVESLHRLCSR